MSSSIPVLPLERHLRRPFAVVRPELAALLVGNRNAVVAEIRQAATMQVRSVVLDCSRIDTMDNVGLGALVAVQRELRADGKAFFLASVSENVETLIRLLDLERHFAVLDEVPVEGAQDSAVAHG